MRTPRQAFREDLAKRPLFRWAGRVYLCAGVATLLDALTTVIGLGIGLQETAVPSIFFIHVFGTPGVVLLRLVVAAPCFLLYLGCRRREGGSAAAYGLLMVGVIFLIIFLLPVANNLTYIIWKLLG